MGTPKGIRNIIAIGDVNGITESHVARAPDGSFINEGVSINVSISGNVRGNVNCWESVSLSTIDPTDAKRDA